MDFAESLQYMEGLLRFGWKLGNERFEALCARLGNPQDRYSVLHVAGTKGKGSTTALAAGILHAAGYRVGGYFSPYVYDPCERVQVDGAMIPRDDFARLVTQIRPHIEALARTELGQTTEFELKTALGFLYFAECGVEIACVEVGLGGRLDATNIVKPAVTVITTIGLDHTAQLGDTHALIAGEKAGIIKCGVPCYSGVEHPEAFPVIEWVAQQQQAPLTRVRRGPVTVPTHDAALVHWDTASMPAAMEQGRAQTEQMAPLTVATETRRYADMEVRLAGLYQRANAACAVAAVEGLLTDRGATLTADAVQQALATTTLPGRMERVRLPHGPLVVLDGAHNEMAAQALAGAVAALRAQEGTRRLLLVVGMLTGHEPEGVLAPFVPQADRVYVCQPDWKRAFPAEEVAAIARRYGSQVEVIPSVSDAVNAAIAAANPDDMVLVTGSFYTVGEVRLSCTSGNADGVPTSGYLPPVTATSETKFPAPLPRSN
jgi:dihydrofolate synthase / folylpolyglutamate synthase